MKSFYKKSMMFWFVLLFLALFNAVIREMVYKPLLMPFIGVWAHQISAVTGILLFFAAIYLFLKKMRSLFVKKDLIRVGLFWMLATIVFENAMNVFIRKLSWGEILHTYYFWEGELWLFVLISLVILPLMAGKILKGSKW